MECTFWKVLFLMLLSLHSATSFPIDAGPAPGASYYQEENEPAPPQLANLPPYNTIGALPDFYAVNWGISSPSDPIYEENSTDYEEGECHSVSNCPWEYPIPQDSYPFLSNNLFLGMPYLPTSHGVDTISCNMEADCFAQDEIPGNLSRATDVLFLRSSTFTTLQIGNLSVLPPLVKLRISYSDLQMIYPGSFTSQSTLQTLELVGNEIDQILPSTFAELINLEILDLSSNVLFEVKSEMFIGLSKLKELIIGSNLLEEIPNYAFSKLPQLRELTLEDNNITFIAQYAFSGMQNLKSLYLNHNQLSSVPSKALHEIPPLVNLQLSGNSLRKIYKNDFKGMDKLRSLWLDDCGLVKIARKAFQNKNIKTLVLSDNELESLPNLRTLARLQTVRLDNNPLSCDCDLWWIVRWFRRKNVDTPSEGPQCASPPHLVGSRALELTNVDLCSLKVAEKTPDDVTKIGRTMQPLSSAGTKDDDVTGSGSTEDRGTMSYDDENTSDHTNDYYSEMAPGGGWSNQPYDIEKLYTISDTERTTPEIPGTPEIEGVNEQPPPDVTPRIVQATKSISSLSTTSNNTVRSISRSVATIVDTTKNPTQTATDEKETPAQGSQTSRNEEKATTTHPIATDLSHASTKQDTTVQVQDVSEMTETSDNKDSREIPTFQPVCVFIVISLGILLFLFVVALVKIKLYKGEEKRKRNETGDELRLRPSPETSKPANIEKQAPLILISDESNGAVAKTEDKGEFIDKKQEAS